MRRTLKFLTAAVAAVAPALAGAQQVNFVGSTLGCFFQLGGCAPSAFASVGTLSYTAGTFNVYTDPAGTSGTSFGAVGSSGTLDSHGALTSTGSFTSTAGPGQWFLRLQTTLTSPTVAGSNVFTNDFAILGSTSAPLAGGLHFTPINPLIYSGPYTNGAVLGGGTNNGVVNSWTYDNQSLTSGHTVTLSSFLVITSTTTPEPASLALMATGILALAGAGIVRRRDA